MKQIKIKEKGLKEGKMKRLNEHGITLVALVVTIIIMLILAGVAIRLTLGENGLFTMSRNATGKYKKAQTNEQQEMKATEKEFKKLTQGLTVTATVNGEEIDITKDNFGKYLGMEVTNFKDSDKVTGETETVSIIDGNSDNEGTDYIVSTKYRLYYVDFDNKYGDGAGTIYLKADCVSRNYVLQLDRASADEEKVKIKQLNPSLYKNDVQAPSIVLTWLVNTEKWVDVERTVKEEVKEEINYIVGAPSLEMMVDSYNTHYGLTGDEPVPGDIEEGGERKKLFYKYKRNEHLSTKGYQVGPGNSLDYDTVTANYTVKSDEHVDTMYYPGNGNRYWLASPSYYDGRTCCRINSKGGGYIDIGDYQLSSGMSAFCPLVSLKSSYNLELSGKIPE